MLGKARDTQVMVDHRAVRAAQPVGAGEKRAGPVCRRTRLAQGGPALGAGLAVAAGRHDVRDEAVQDRLQGKAPTQFEEAQSYDCFADAASFTLCP